MSTDAETTATATVDLPPAVHVSLEGRRLVAQGPLGKVERPFPADILSLKVDSTHAELTLLLPPNRRRSRALLQTWVAHLKNLAGGVTHGVEARMKVVAAHFPMKVQAHESRLVIENFLGEKYPRTAPLVPGVKATVQGDLVVLSGHDVEEVGQAAANIERATRIRDYDPRVFQDGIYLIEHAHVKESR